MGLILPSQCRETLHRFESGTFRKKPLKSIVSRGAVEGLFGFWGLRAIRVPLALPRRATRVLGSIACPRTVVSVFA